MDEPIVIISLTVSCVLLAEGLLFFFLCKANGGRMGRALKCCFRSMVDDVFGEKVTELLTPPPPKPAAPPKPSGEPVRLLALLQRDGRLLDFLLENIQSYDDAQIGAAVRDIHRQCQAALKEHLVLSPVIAQQEGATVDVPVGFDPSAIRLTGNVTGQPPFRGTLQHHGWRVTESKFAPLPEGQDPLVLMPAEVEIQ